MPRRRPVCIPAITGAAPGRLGVRRRHDYLNHVYTRLYRFRARFDHLVRRGGPAAGHCLPPESALVLRVPICSIRQLGFLSPEREAGMETSGDGYRWVYCDGSGILGRRITVLAISRRTFPGPLCQRQVLEMFGGLLQEL